MTHLEIKLPDDVMAHLPTEKSALIACLSRHFDKVLDQYELRLPKRLGAPLNGPLSRYERATLKDFLMDQVLGDLLHLYEPSLEARAASAT